MTTNLDSPTFAQATLPEAGEGAPEDAACGCQEGAAATFVALLLLVAQGVGYLNLPGVGAGPLSWAAFLFGAALLGKVAGLSLAAVRRREIGNEAEEVDA
jgi:hypothetical protein